ncbi:hypothetical protein [Paraconexibacter sp. AEG42_29]|uniref:hypothetical protein n=1 Tax=Paraconexibacter sp. AEG42_29 TaxID=2997339 RepID=UPI00339D810B
MAGTSHPARLNAPSREGVRGWRYGARRLMMCGAATALALTGAGCGESGGQDDQAAVRKAVTAGLTGAAQQRCVSAATPRLIAALYRSRDRCTYLVSRTGPDTDTSVRVTGIDRNEDRAKVNLRLDGGDFAGSVGHVEALRGPSGSWRLDELGTDLLRSMLADPARTTDPVDKQTFGCVARTTSGLSDPAFRRVAHALIGARPRDVPAAVKACFYPARDDSD